MRDWLPADMARFRRIEDAFRQGCAAYGYDEVKPPTIEYLQLFTALGTLTPAMVGRVYSFLDWDGWTGERVVLRPDSTIPVARLYVEHLSPRVPCRLFYVTNSFVFEETGSKQRERWQCGAEFIGGAPVVSDVEMVLLAQDVMARLGLDGMRFQVCHAGLLKALIEELDLDAGAKQHLIESVLEGDWSGLQTAVAQVGDTKRYLAPLLQLKGVTAGYLGNIRALASSASSDFRTALDQFIQVATVLDDLECGYEIDITAVRNFEYYTGICFQLVSPDGEKVGGGGRYDDLIPLMGGPQTSACGFALYMDQLIGLLTETPWTTRGVAVVCDDASPGTLCRTLAAARAVRGAGGPAVVGIRRGAEFTSQFRWVLRIRPESSDTVLLTNAETREQIACSLSQAIERILAE
ncbi:MAG: histidine--tRNA ligase family protein [Dehalococcoidia bacterium]|nr:histidine--tRNA ligase family protein [Dehalococcoidia bacterium]